MVNRREFIGTSLAAFVASTEAHGHIVDTDYQLMLLRSQALDRADRRLRRPGGSQPARRAASSRCPSPAARVTRQVAGWFTAFGGTLPSSTATSSCRVTRYMCW